MIAGEKKLEKLILYSIEQSRLCSTRPATQKKLQAMQHDSKISYFFDDYFSDEK
jgi:hypothetical protein